MFYLSYEEMFGLGARSGPFHSISWGCVHIKICFENSLMCSILRQEKREKGSGVGGGVDSCIPLPLVAMVRPVLEPTGLAGRVVTTP